MKSCDNTSLHDVITRPGRWSSHWAGSEVGEGKGWDPAGTRPGCMPHLRSRRGTAASAGRCHSFPSRHTTSPGWCWEGCPTCRTSAASRPAEMRNSAEEECELSALGKSLNHKVKMGRLAGCCCEHLRGLLARASVGPDDGVPAEHDSELLWRTGSYLLVQHHRENTWTNDKETKSPNITLTDQYLLNWTFRRKLHKLKGPKSHYYIISSSTIFQIPASDRDWSAVKTPGGSHPSHISSNKWQKKKKLPDHSVMPAAPRFGLLSGRAARYFSVNSQWNPPRWQNRTCRHRGL